MTARGVSLERDPPDDRTPPHRKRATGGSAAFSLFEQICSAANQITFCTSVTSGPYRRFGPGRFCVFLTGRFNRRMAYFRSYPQTSQNSFRIRVSSPFTTQQYRRRIDSRYSSLAPGLILLAPFFSLSTIMSQRCLQPDLSSQPLVSFNLSHFVQFMWFDGKPRILFCLPAKIPPRKARGESFFLVWSSLARSSIPCQEKTRSEISRDTAPINS